MRVMFRGKKENTSGTPTYKSPKYIYKQRLILTLDAAVLHRDDLRGSRRGERLQLQRVPGWSAVWGGAAGVNLSLLLC